MMSRIGTRSDAGATPPPAQDAGRYSAIIVETHRAMKADVTVIVHGESDGLVRVLHGLCQAAIRQVVAETSPGMPVAG